MLTTLSLTTLALIFAQSEDLPPEDTPPTPQEQEQPTIEPAEALDKIKAAIKSDGEAVILDAIEVCADVKDKKVITEIAKLLKHKSEDIRYAALEALRFNEHQESLKRLLAFGKNKIFKSDVEYHIEYIYALGQKADKKAAKLITEDFTVSSNSSDDLLKARIYSLGRIRDVDSIEKLLQFSKSSFRGQRRRSSPKITQPVQTSLAVLTGVELGNELYAWTDWWNDNKRGFKMSETEGTIANGRLQNQWKAMWMTEEQKAQAIQDARDERASKRKDNAKNKDEKAGDKKKEDDDGLIDF